MTVLPLDSVAIKREVRSPYRHDIDGLRAVAVLLVVAYHVWLGRVSGGVDVFLMISAFFLTESFARRIESQKLLELRAFWVRRFVRLLPAASVTVLGVLALSYVVFPPSRWPEIWSQSWASIFYVQNWELAFNAVDYYERVDSLPSPLQHFWSLSIQGQVFILWPLIFLFAAFVAARLRRSPRAVLAVLFSTVFLSSLAFSIWQTLYNQQFAYFDTRARLWEFALGSLVALALPFIRVSPRWGAFLGWLGLVGLVSCGLVLDVAGGFPGYFALWPTLSAAAVIVGGVTASRWGPSAALSCRPLRALGRNAYALYLVHWPILIAWLAVTGASRARIQDGFIIVLLSLGAATLLRLAVEDPARRLTWPTRSLRLGFLAVLLSAAVALVPLAAWQAFERISANRAQALAEQNNPGARAVLPGAPDLRAGADLALLPVATELDAEWISLDRPCEESFAPQSAILTDGCFQLAPKYGAGRVVVVIGDSHAQQLMGALLPVAEREGWNVVALLRGGCALAAEEPSTSDRASCDEWRESAIDYAINVAPDAVFTVATAAEPDGPGERRSRGLQGQIDTLTSAGIDVIAVRDNPRFTEDIFECVERASTPWERCSRSVQDALAQENPALSFGGPEEGVFSVDFTDYLCPEGECRAVIGNVVVYLDDNHLTGMYARSLSPVLQEQLQSQGW